MPLSNYPDGMSRLDLQHVGEIDWDDEEEEGADDPDADEVEADADDSWADE